MLTKNSDRSEFSSAHQKYTLPRLMIAAGIALAGISVPALAGAGKAGHHHGKGHHEEVVKKHHDGHHHGMHQEHQGHRMDHTNMPGGRPGKASEVDRKIEILAKDIEFNLKTIRAKNGETIHFVIRNTGELVHEFTIGLPSMQKAHQAEMLKLMESGKLEADRIVDDSGHSHPNTVLIGPKSTKEIIWKFSTAKTLEFGCNIPGHYEAGMRGKFVFTEG